ncbi:MAG: hypothetical protein GXX79_18750 [Actinomycetales bacterium]|nr:hypothetical protein [Actinomycetales bacterium]
MGSWSATRQNIRRWIRRAGPVTRMTQTSPYSTCFGAPTRTGSSICPLSLVQIRVCSTVRSMPAGRKLTSGGKMSSWTRSSSSPQPMSAIFDGSSTKTSSADPFRSTWTRSRTA